MTTDDAPSPPPRPAPTRLPTLWQGLAGGVLLLVVLCGALLLGLQSKTGQQLLARLLENWFSTPTSRLEVRDLHGRLPWDLHIGQLRWQDPDGTWLTVEQLHLNGSFTDGQLHLHGAGAERVHLYRQPRHTPPAPTEPTPWHTLLASTLWGGVPPLRVEQVQITELILDEAAFGQAARFALSGEIRHLQDPDTPTSPTNPVPTQLLARLHLRPLDEGETQLNLEARLTPAGPLRGDSRLSVTLDGHERSGLSAALTGLPAARGMTLHVSGHGALAHWQGQLAATLEGVGGVEGVLQLQDGTPPRLGFQGQLRGEPALLGPSWSALLTGIEGETRVPPGRAEAQPVAALAIELEWLPSRQLRLGRLALDTPGAHLQGQGSLALADQQLQGALQLEIPRLAPLTGLAGVPLQGSLAATLTAQGHRQHPQFQLSGQINEMVVATLRAKQLLFHGQAPLAGESATTASLWRLHGTLLGVGAGEAWPAAQQPWTWSAELAQPVGGPLRWQRLEITEAQAAAPSSLVLQGELDPLQGRGQGHWQLTVGRLADWLKGVFPELSHLEGRGQWSGLFALVPPTGEHPEGGGAPFTATISGGVEALQGVLQPLVGASVRTEARLAVWPARRLEITELHMQGAGVNAQGRLQGDLRDRQVVGQFHVGLAELAPLSELAGVTLKGGVEGEVQLTGSFATPQLQVALHTPAVDIGPLHWDNPKASLSIEGLPSHPHGRLKLEVPADDKGQRLPRGVLSGHGNYRLQGVQLQLSDLHLPWPGGEVTGERLQVDLSRWILEGRLQGRSSTPGPWLQWLLREASPLPADLEGSLALQVQWLGRGRQQSAEVALDGQLLRSLQLSRDGFGLLDKGSLRAKLTDVWGEPGGTLEGELGKMRWGNTQLRAAHGSLTGNRQAAQLTLSGKGVFAAAEGSGSQPVALPARRSGTGQPLPEGFDLQAKATLGVDGKGVVRGTVAELTGQLGAERLQLEQAAHIILTPNPSRGGTHLDLDRLQVRYGTARLDGHARYDAQKVDIKADLRLPLSLLSRWGWPDLQGSAQAHLQLGGAPTRPEGVLTVDLEQVHATTPSLEAIPPAMLHAQARLEKGQVHAQVAVRELTSSPITALLLFPLQVGFAPLRLTIPAGGALGGTLNADAQLTQFALLAAPGMLDTQKLDGTLNIALRLGGKVAAPEVQGEIQVRNGSYENGALGTLLKGIHLDATAHGQTIAIHKLEATDGDKGRLHATGQLTLDRSRHMPFRLEGTLEKGMLVRRDEWQATLSGPLVVQGNTERLEVTGELTSNELLFYLTESESLDIKTVPVDMEIRHGLRLAAVDAARPQAATPVALNVALHLPGRVFLRGRGLESEWQGELTVRGQASEPRIEGEVLVRRGYFEFLDQKFELRKGVIAFDGTTATEPRLDLEAESKNVNNIVAILRLQGPALTPTLRLDSEPELAQDEILARLLFNRNRQQLTPAQALSLAVAVEKLRNGGPGLLGKARDRLGIDRLELGGESVEAGSVKAGKYISDKVFVGVERGVKQGTGKVSVELEMTPHVTLQTEMDETNKSGVGVNWKYDY
ncbi:MAG: translocation/assembly module TamB [Magnetococcus sp. MYC-9]